LIEDVGFKLQQCGFESESRVKDNSKRSQDSGIVSDDLETRQPDKRQRVEDKRGLGRVPGAKKENRDERMGCLQMANHVDAAERQTADHRDVAEQQVARQMANLMDAMEQELDQATTIYPSKEQEEGSRDSSKGLIPWMLLSSRNYPERLPSIQERSRNYPEGLPSIHQRSRKRF
jgi:hypothetical protein